jgi:hypothetical protein
MHQDHDSTLRLPPPQAGDARLLGHRGGLPARPLRAASAAVWRLLRAAWRALAGAPAEGRLAAGHAALVTECCAYARCVVQSGDASALLLLLSAPPAAGATGEGGGEDDAPALLPLIVELLAERPPHEAEVLHPLWLAKYDVAACVAAALRSGDCRVVNEARARGAGRGAGSAQRAD